MNKAQQPRQTKKTRSDAVAAHDPLIVELVMLLARSAAERDYARVCRSNAKGKAAKRQGE
jgi:hypothetical protein